MASAPRSLLIVCFLFQAFQRVVRSLKPGAFSLLIFCASSVGAVCGKDHCLCFAISSLTKGCMVRTRSRATSPDHQESRDASSNPHHDRQLALVMQPSSIQHVQSMAAAMAELTRQNQELTSKINLRRQRYEGYAKGQTQSHEDRGNAEFESQSKGTTSRKVPYLEREMDQMRKVMDKMRENMRRVNLIEDLVH